MVSITLISIPQAKEGGRFYYLGPQPECDECKLKKVCVNLEQGHLYEIISVREQTHDCVLNEDKVKVVEVNKTVQMSAVPKRSAIEGGIITLKEPECKKLDCKNYRVCHPYALENGKKYKITNVKGSAECPIYGDLVLVTLL
ncbi:hypothetical protein Mpt1_c02760 [Candidatus Methanoplasma termitum]|uniref:UPF0179 protein Mpt1_c02760 n=1 Tax=Candidatus Methanoplasma termitum TaxID=1577791 RepID=A0A0A7LFA9_9ARCH|nr:UPF0179 family protein [Candidatus Methanoplasma termitum]AIZ56176.1 hypothetical protein Mpt1_c02760 [Candidatus Methanoplasma termitum]MCL2333518.1 UPF0179 family protein [Candidatus Methanoplasma sp.]